MKDGITGWVLELLVDYINHPTGMDTSRQERLGIALNTFRSRREELCNRGIMSRNRIKEPYKSFLTEISTSMD